ncbi:MAG: hypothetical protein RL375_1749 [Pseudomonadota bacterium]
MMKTRKLAHAAILAAGFLATPLFVAACPANMAKPFTSGPLDAQGMFSQWIVDANGVGLKVCTDASNALGDPPPCFMDPIVPGNSLSETLGRGGEAFMFLADSVFTTPGTAPIDAVIVLGVETAFLSADGAPEAGTQIQFQRRRTRLNVAAIGIYTVETPWGKTTYRVTDLLPPGSGQNRAEVSEPIDISFGPNSSVPGLVSPFLLATPEIPGFGQAQGYIGDGLTPTTVSGSPCGDNFIRITATGLDGVTPIPINNVAPLNVYTNNLFTVQGKLDLNAGTPLSVGAAYYSRAAGVDSLTLIAEGSTSPTAVVTADINGPTATPLVHEAGTSRYYVTQPVTLPATVSLTSVDTTRGTQPVTLPATVTDLVTVTRASAACSGTTAATRNCVLTVDAVSSDDGSNPNDTAPVFTLAQTGDTFTGSVSVNSKALPAAVTVRSSKGGVAVKPVTVINN